MDQSAIGRPNTGEPATASAAHAAGPWLKAARAVWLVLVVSGLGLYAIGFPPYVQQLQVGCVDTATCYITGGLPASQLHQLATIGVSADAYAAVMTCFFVINIVIWGGVGLLIFWRRLDDWLALLAASLLVTQGISGTAGPAYALTLVVPAVTWAFSLVFFLGQVAIAVFFLLFPSGRLVPRWIWPLLPLGLVYGVLNSFPSVATPYVDAWPEWFFSLVGIAFPGLILGSQIYRYARISTPIERLQTKWIVVGVALAIGLPTGFFIVAIFIRDLTMNPAYTTAWSTSYAVAQLLIPIAFGFSILRYRLYDIDILINRALVYGSLTALLGAIYFGLVIGMQTVTHVFTGQSQQSPIVIVLSTLLIASLFQPLRRRIQRMIDRRFYRAKYDAAKTVERFAATLRQQVELDELNTHLVEVVRETVQPEHVSLWLRSPQRQRDNHV